MKHWSLKLYSLTLIEYLEIHNITDLLNCLIYSGSLILNCLCRRFAAGVCLRHLCHASIMPTLITKLDYKCILNIGLGRKRSFNLHLTLIFGFTIRFSNTFPFLIIARFKNQLITIQRLYPQLLKELGSEWEDNVIYLLSYFYL